MAKPPRFDELKRALWHPVADEHKERRRAQLAAAVEEAALRPSPVARTRRRFSVVAVTAALLALPAGVALAAENALPGEALYPVKRVTETVRSWVDDDIVAEHRVDELEELLAAGAPNDRITDQVDRASTEVDRLRSDHVLQGRLAAALRDVAVGGDVRRDGTDHAGPPVSTPRDRQTETTVPTTETTTPAITDTTTTTRAVDQSTTTVVDATSTTVTDQVRVQVLGLVRAGPTCPVERQPPDPECEDQPVAGAVLLVKDDRGREVAVVESNDEGRFQLRLEAGRYTLEPQPYEGLLGTAPPQEFVVSDAVIELLVEYDTGIR